MSNPIDLFLATDSYNMLALGTRADGSSSSMHIASCECSALQKFVEEGHTFRDWVKEEFIKSPNKYLNDLRDSILYRYGTERHVHDWLNDRGFYLPVLRHDENRHLRFLQSSGVPFLSNTSRIYLRQVDRLFDLTLLYDWGGNPYVRLERRPVLCRFIAVDDQRNLPYWLIQPWDWNIENWAKYGIVRSEVFGEPLEPHCLKVPEDGNPEGITHRLTGLRARELEEALDGQSLDGAKHMVLPYLRYVGNGAECGLNLNHPSSVYEGEIRYV